MNKNEKILVLGARGMVGSAIVRDLKKNGYTNILGPIRYELDLTCQSDVLKYFETNKPNHVFFAAAKVGGIHANNTYRADFIHQNLMIQSNVFEASFRSKIEKLLFLGSSCIYPKNAPQPLKEEYLLTAPLEPTNEPYAIAKIAGLKTAESFRRQYGCKYYSVMPTNLYGENDNYDLNNSHVIPGLIARMNKAKVEGAKEFAIWGTGNPRREFLYVDDMAHACVHIMEQSEEVPGLLNIGTGEDISIKELAYKIKEIIGFKGHLTFDSTQPDGTLKKLLDVSKIRALGWKHTVSLDEGLKKTIKYFLEKIE